MDSPYKTLAVSLDDQEQVCVSSTEEELDDSWLIAPL
jgi:hypothetical protein